MACNDDGAATTSAITLSIAAGQTINAHYDQNWTAEALLGEGLPPVAPDYYQETWPHEWGPAMAYMAACDGPCDSLDPSTLKWFKIYEAGLISGTALDGRWLVTDLYNGAPFSTQIPSTLRPGNYLLRHEVIAVHLQSEKQFYMECVQIDVTGDGDDFPIDEDYFTTFPGAYSLYGTIPSRHLGSNLICLI